MTRPWDTDTKHGESVTAVRIIESSKLAYKWTIQVYQLKANPQISHHMDPNKGSNSINVYLFFTPYFQTLCIKVQPLSHCGCVATDFTKQTCETEDFYHLDKKLFDGL